jgi:hypothetical protein
MKSPAPQIGQIVYANNGAKSYNFYKVIEISDSGYVTYQQIAQKEEFGETPYPSIVAIMPVEEKIGKPFKIKSKSYEFLT